MGCVFCSTPEDRKVYAGKLWFAIRDKFPVVEGHTLIIPNRHVRFVDELTEEEWASVFPLVKRFGGIDFNLGINRGAAAGQTVFHVHIHVFPRIVGDVDNPRGGIRNFKTALVPY